MRIVITEMPGARPIVVEGLKAVLLAALDAKADGTAPVVAKGQPRQIAQCAVMALMSVRHKLGEEMFEAVIRVARENEYLSAEDITDKVRAAPTRAEMSRDPSALDSGGSPRNALTQAGESCKRCGHPQEWHHFDDRTHADPTLPGAPFRCIGYDCDVDGPPFEGACDCPDFVEATHV